MTTDRACANCAHDKYQHFSAGPQCFKEGCACPSYVAPAPTTDRAVVEYRPVKCVECGITFSSHPDFLNHLAAIERHGRRLVSENISDEAIVRAASEAMADSEVSEGPLHLHEREKFAALAVAAVLPLIEARVRTQMAADIRRAPAEPTTEAGT